MSQHTLSVESRELRGKEAAKRLRREGKLPAVIYGHKETPVSLTINAKELSDLLHHHGSHGFLTLKGAGADMTAIIKSFQRHPVKNIPTSVDFLRVSLNEEITVTVPIHLENEPLDVKSGDGLLVQSLHEITITAAASTMPQSITVDISGLVLNGPAIHISEITLPAGVVAVNDGDEAIAAVNPPTKADLDAPMDEADAAVEAEGMAKAEEAVESNTAAPHDEPGAEVAAEAAQQVPSDHGAATTGGTGDKHATGNKSDTPEK